MGFAILEPEKIPVKLDEAISHTLETGAVEAKIDINGTPTEVMAISMGNPHCITFVDDIEKVPLAEIGPYFESHKFFPQKANTEFVEVVSRSELKMLVWERGAGATLACGTGTCALALASHLSGRSNKKVLVHLPGGDLNIEIEEIEQQDAQQDYQYKIWMTGAADFVFSGNAQIGGDQSVKVSEI